MKIKSVLVYPKGQNSSEPIFGLSPTDKIYYKTEISNNTVIVRGYENKMEGERYPIPIEEYIFHDLSVMIKSE